MNLEQQERKLILSICIPTYNRVENLIELIEECLKIEAGDIEICVTDNKSTDGTVTCVKELKDPRIRVEINNKPVIAYVNMIQSIYNAKGKYALYMNDRDLLDHEKVNQLIAVLREGEFAFLRCGEKNRQDNGTFEVFHSAFESLAAHPFSHHPTGMVFNRELIEKHVPREEIFSYKHPREGYYWSFLARELFKYGKTAIWNNGLWRGRSRYYLYTHKSGNYANRTTVFFLPPNRVLQMKQVMYQVFEKSEFDLSENEKFMLAKLMIESVSDCGGFYKYLISDTAQCARYDLKKEYISFCRRLKIDCAAVKNMAEFMKKRGYPEAWIDYQRSYLGNNFLKLLKSDFRMIYFMIRREIRDIYRITIPSMMASGSTWIRSERWSIWKRCCVMERYHGRNGKSEE